MNLRGFSPGFEWYVEECRVARDRDANQLDLSFSASRLPATSEVRRLIEALENTDYPVLMHCRQGADRTGLAAMVALLLLTNAGLNEARNQLSPRYGHFAVGRTGHLDRFLGLYTQWLKGNGLSHRSEHFRQWGMEAYCPLECRAHLSEIDIPQGVRPDRPSALRVRATNTSADAWRLSADNNVGIHMGFVLKDAEQRSILSGRSGLFDAEVKPGESMDFTLVLPAVRKPGRYHLVVDMVDESHCWFYQVGSEPLERELIVED
jgi:hypothetical protein